jgi:hypothetical protein
MKYHVNLQIIGRGTNPFIGRPRQSYPGLKTKRSDQTHYSSTYYASRMALKQWH